MADQAFPENSTTPDESLWAAAFARGNVAQYVESGLGFTADFTNDELDIASGTAHLLDNNQGYTLQPDARNNLSLSGSATNHVFLVYDPSTDTISYTINTTGTAPANPSVKIGTVDTANDTTTETNRDASPDVETLTVVDTGADPTANGEVTRNGGDVKVHTGGVVKSLTDIGSGGGGSNATVAWDESELTDGSFIQKSIPVPDTQTIEVLAWGVWTSGNTTPTGLTVELLDESETVITSENTGYTSGSPVTSDTNSTGATAFYRLRLENGTGTDYVSGNSPDSVFGYVEFSVA